MSEELKPCPHCNKTDGIVLVKTGPAFQWTCINNGCPGSRSAKTSAEAMQQWNRRAPGWQTMDSAPRDGTEVILYKRGYVIVAYFSGNEDEDEPNTWILNDGNEYPRLLRQKEYTHWMPLPEPPKGETE